MLAVKRFFLSLFVFAGIDAPWIIWVVLPMYRASFGHLLTFRWQPALVFYGVFMTGLVYFVLSPSKVKLKQDRVWLDALMFGWTGYGVYAWTLYAVFDFYTLPIALADWLWGGVICWLTTWVVRACLPDPECE